MGRADWKPFSRTHWTSMAALSTGCLHFLNEKIRRSQLVLDKEDLIFLVN